MGRLGRLLAFAGVIRNNVPRGEAKLDPGGGPNITADHFAPAGDDAHPLPGDYVIVSRVPRSGGYGAVGYLDPSNTPKAALGEKRLYARAPDTGAVVVEVWLQNTGQVVVQNDNASLSLAPDGSIAGANASGNFTLQAGGNFEVNGAVIDTDGRISSPTAVAAPSIQAAGKELAGHDHPAGDPPGNTGPNQ